MAERKRKRIVSIRGEKFIFDPNKQMLQTLRPKEGFDKDPQFKRTPPSKSKIIISDAIKKRIEEEKRKRK